MRKFGLCKSSECKDDSSFWQSCVVSVVKNGGLPTGFEDYTGRKEYVPQNLWYLRNWAIALGGIEYMDERLILKLFEAERVHDKEYVFASMSDGRGGREWEHVMKAWPSIVLPGKEVWMRMCHEHPGRVEEMLAAIFEERIRVGITFDCCDKQYKITKTQPIEKGL